MYDSTDLTNLQNLKVFQYVENFIQFRLQADGVQVMVYDFGLNKLPIKFSKHKDWDYNNFFCFVSANNKDEIIYYEEGQNNKEVYALDLLHFALKHADTKIKIDKDLPLGADDKKFGVGMVGLLEGRETQDHIKEKEII